jgi:hypothetical protein
LLNGKPLQNLPLDAFRELVGILVLVELDTVRVLCQRVFGEA